MSRTIVAWVPDWPIIAAVREGLVTAERPIAVMLQNRVVACSSAAREEGVRAGQRRREAQSLCTSLVVVPFDEGRDHRLFAPLIDAVESLVAGVQVVRPGLLALSARGPARYYGGEKAAALALRGALIAEGVADARLGVADGPFAAELAARSTSSVQAGSQQSVRIVPPDAAGAFLAPFPVATLGDADLVTLLGRLGVRTLGDFAALPAEAVRDRFGAAGAHRHALAGAADATPLVPRTPPPDLERVLELEPPLDRVDQLAFAVRQLADELVESLVGRLLVATAIRIGFRDEHGIESERAWLHPRSFRASEIVDRVRWQLSGETRTLGARAGAPGSDADRGPGLRSAITRVRIMPESVDALAHHEPGLWGSAPDERVHHALSRVQSLLGHEAVLTAQRTGGRTLAERGTLVPWGDRLVETRPVHRPWPGALPQPTPGTVFPTRHAVTVSDARGAPIGIDDRMRLSAPPAGFAPSAGGATRPVTSWAGPWPLDERWWEPSGRRLLHRLQVVDSAGIAWLLVLDGASWWAEARYD